MATRGEYVYLNGSIIHSDKAVISPFDVGLLRGYAVFDLLQTIDGVPYMLTEHLARLRASAGTLGLGVPLSDAEIETIILDLLGRNAHAEATVRVVLTGGDSPDGMHFDAAAPTFLIVTHELFDVPASFYATGAKLLAVEHRREFPEAKTTNYLTWLRNHARIEAEGALDLLYHDRGVVSEAATASFYAVKDGRILAPDSGVLWGTVGSRVLDLARETYEVVLCEVTMDDVLGADECFLTSSVRDVVPIVKIDENVIGDGSVGPVTRELMARYRLDAHGE